MLSEKALRGILFALVYLVFLEGLSWHTASWPPPCLVSEPHQEKASEQHHEKQCVTFLAGLAILSAKGVDLIKTHDNDKVIVALFTIVLAISTIGLWLATIGLYRAGERQIAHLEQTAERQAREMRDSLALTAAGVAASQRSAQAAIWAELPAVFIAEAYLVGPNPEGVATAFKGEPLEAGRRYYINVDLRNVGKNPAIVTRYAVEAKVAAQLPLEPEYPNARGGTFVIESKDIYTVPATQPITLTPEQIADVDAERQFFWVWGFVLYRDFMESNHEVGFISGWRSEGGANCFVEAQGTRYTYTRYHPAPLRPA